MVPVHVEELITDPNLEAIFTGTVTKEHTVYCVYDKTETDQVPHLVMEEADEVIVTLQIDGTYFVHFMSLTPGLFHYKAPANTDAITIEEEVYHV